MAKKTRSGIGSSAFLSKSILIAGLLIFAAVCGIFFMSKPARMPQNVIPNAIAEPVYTEAIVFGGEYRTAMYDIREGYPAPLLRIFQSVPETKRTALRCSGHIVGEGTEFFVREAETHAVTMKISDSRVLGVLRSIQESINSPGELLSAKVCETEAKDLVIEYAAGVRVGAHSDYGDDTSVFIAYIPQNAIFTKGIKVIEYPHWPYPNCRKPLLLTNDGILYYECGITTEDEVNATYHKIDLIHQTTAQLAKCIYTYKGKPTKSCR